PEEVPLVNRSEPKYGVSMVSMNVSLDSAIPAERAKALEEFVKKVFAPAFGDRLFVRTEVAPYIDKESPSFFDRLEKFQKLAYLSLILFTILLLSLIWKLIPTRRTPHE